MDFHEQPTPDRMSADVQKAAAHSTFGEFCTAEQCPAFNPCLCTQTLRMHIVGEIT